MIVLTLRTEKPEAEVAVYQDGKQCTSVQWEAHRALSSTLLRHITDQLKHCSLSEKDLQGIIVFQGPGSFTGLRIGVSVVNALGSSLAIPVVATQGDDWIEIGLTELTSKHEFSPVEPFYGADAHITTPKK